eukprot:872567_1
MAQDTKGFALNFKHTISIIFILSIITLFTNWFSSNHIQISMTSSLYLNLSNNTNTSNINEIITSTKKATIPLSHLPQQKEISIEQITIHERFNSKCNFQGKTFVLGVSKTG